MPDLDALLGQAQAKQKKKFTRGLRPDMVLNSPPPSIEQPENKEPEIRAAEIQVTQTQVPRIQEPQIRVTETRVPEFKGPEIQDTQNQAPQIKQPEIQGPDIQVTQTQAPQIQSPDIQEPDYQQPEIRASRPLKKSPTLKAKQPEFQAPEIRGSDSSKLNGFFPMELETATRFMRELDPAAFVLLAHMTFEAYKWDHEIQGRRKGITDWTSPKAISLEIKMAKSTVEIHQKTLQELRLISEHEMSYRYGKRWKVSGVLLAKTKGERTENRAPENRAPENQGTQNQGSSSPLSGEPGARNSGSPIYEVDALDVLDSLSRNPRWTTYTQTLTPKAVEREFLALENLVKTFPTDGSVIFDVMDAVRKRGKDLRGNPIGSVMAYLESAYTQEREPLVQKQRNAAQAGQEANEKAKTVAMQEADEIARQKREQAFCKAFPTAQEQDQAIKTILKAAGITYGGTRTIALIKWEESRGVAE